MRELTGPSSNGPSESGIVNFIGVSSGPKVVLCVSAFTVTMLWMSKLTGYHPLQVYSISYPDLLQ